ncbi:hypothetical protein M422DRAFT_275023 [Sphaerobolus stellatus SS14]|uniref:Uncharacterized protein n=1 Tax=Sphaerobolus stellatus (strain SS14) TaxID=990650 RepID=A0A0C9U560_SPHS4|nr:hypothetical protein M422DRAFT_275023 [Sphaerobolus stellatus SS14]
MDQTKHHFESGLENIKSIQDIMQSLARQRIACHSCTLTTPSQLEPPQEISFQSPSDPAGHQDQNLPLPDDGVDILTCNLRNIKIIRIDPDFDDYNTGHTIQETMGILSASEQPEEHYLPINHHSGEHILPESLKRWDLTRRNNTREAISDICFLGMQELLELAGDIKSGNGFDLFIRGIRYDPEDCEKEEMIHLDITRDAVPTENVPVYISVDIDSLIWKTHHLQLKASINIHMAPYMQAKPPYQYS